MLQGYGVTRLQGYEVTRLQGYGVKRHGFSPQNENCLGLIKI